MPSPAENAATVRLSRDYMIGEPGVDFPRHVLETFDAALDALLAQAQEQKVWDMDGRLQHIARKAVERAEAASERLADCERQFSVKYERMVAAEAERDRLQHIIDCADTPLMRDVVAERDAAVRENETLLKNIKDEAVQTIIAKEYGSAQFARAEAAERAAEQAQAALRPFVEHLNPKALMQGEEWVERFESYIAAARAALTGEGMGYGPDAGIEFPDDGGES